MMASASCKTFLLLWRRRCPILTFQTIRSISTSCRLGKKKFHPNNHPNDRGRRADKNEAYLQKRATDPRRNLTGEALAQKLKEKAEGVAKYEPYWEGIQAVVERFKVELAAEQKRQFDVEGVYMRQKEEEHLEQLKKMDEFAQTAEELATMRETKQAKLKLHEEEQEEKKLSDLNESLIRRKEENIRLVLQAIDDSKDFVTPENLEEKIDFALGSEINYNYAITPYGEKIYSEKPPGNMNMGKEAGPIAYLSGGVFPGSVEWDLIFKNRVSSFDEKHMSFEQRRSRYEDIK